MRRAVLCLLLAAAGTAAAQSTTPTPTTRVIRGLRYPALSPDGSRIAFCYQGDLWTVSAAGGEARRLAETPGYDTRPRWSPDGSLLAFCNDLHENQDIYTIPAAGGRPTRVTIHTANDLLGDWTPDGKSLLFYSARDSRQPQLHTVRLEDGRVRELTRDQAPVLTPAAAPDGRSVAYVRGRSEWARRGYRGSANGEIYLLPLDAADRTPRRLTDHPGHDSWPMFSADGRWIYYVTDRDGPENLWRLPARGGRPEQVTRRRSGQVHYPAMSRDGRRIVFDWDFSLWIVDLDSRMREPRRLEVTAAVPDAPRTEERVVSAGAREVEISPDGRQLVIAARGDLFLAPAAGGPARRVTDSLAEDADVNWSPDSRELVFVSEREANADLYVMDAATGASRRLTSDPRPEFAPSYSPDGRRIAFLRGANGRQLVTMPAGGGPETVVVDGAFLDSPRWSPDGRWLAYSRRTHAAITNVYACPASGGAEINISRWSGSSVSPTWSPDGRRLSFISSRSGASEIYSVELRAGQPAPPAAGAPPEVVIDAAGIERRVRRLVSQPEGSKSSFAYAPDGRTCLFAGAGSLYSVPAGGGSSSRLAERVGAVLRVAPDGAVFSFTPGTGPLLRVPAGGGAPAEVPYRAAYTVDLKEERRQAFDQAWRLLRDYFYDPGMHGVDWQEVRSRYRPAVDECALLPDFHLLLTEMVGELNASHMGAQPSGTTRIAQETASVGLGFDPDHNGPGLKVAEVVRGGPADQDDARIRPGEYVLSIAGEAAEPRESLYRILAGQGGKRIDLLVNDRPDRAGARTVRVEAVAGTRVQDMLYEGWVEQTRERVERLSGGRLAYLHIRAMDQASLDRFSRELLTVAYDREGLVLDVRNNPGGRIHDELFALLARRVHAFETPRDALKMTQPFGAFTRPMVLLINEGSFSDAEIFANGFRVNRLGRIVGVPTGGGVIGTSNQTLLDRQTTFRVPRTGWLTLDGRNLENYGVPPDIRVELTPADLLAGRDPQVERAVAELLRSLPRRSAR